MRLLATLGVPVLVFSLGCTVEVPADGIAVTCDEECPECPDCSQTCGNLECPDVEIAPSGSGRVALNVWVGIVSGGTGGFTWKDGVMDPFTPCVVDWDYTACCPEGFSPVARNATGDEDHVICLEDLPPQ